jgi:hypothetical protein
VLIQALHTVGRSRLRQEFTTVGRLRFDCATIAHTQFSGFDHSSLELVAL